MKKYWEVLFNDSLKTAEIFGPSYNDEALINRVNNLRKEGYEVHCDTPEYSAYSNKMELIAELRMMGYQCKDWFEETSCGLKETVETVDGEKVRNSGINKTVVNTLIVFNTQNPYSANPWAKQKMKIGLSLWLNI